MKSHVFTLFVFCLALLTAHSSFSQRAPEKFGKIDIADLKMTHYPLDLSEDAIVSQDCEELPIPSLAKDKKKPVSPHLG